MTRILFIVIVSYIFSDTINLMSQQPIEEWVARYSGSTGYEQVINDVKTDNSGNTYITGYVWLNNQFNSRNGITIKINSSGNLSWFNIYNSFSNLADEFNALTVDKLGNCYVTGFSDSSGYLTIKYNQNGDTVWTRSYNSTFGPNSAKDIAVDSIGNVYITGSFYQSNSFTDFATIKYDPSGNQQWVLYYNGLADRNDFAKHLVIDKNNEIIVSGNSQRDNTIDDVISIKYNSGGTVLWTKKYSGINNQGATSINNLISDDSNNIYFSCSALNNDRKIIKYDSMGDSVQITSISDSIYSFTFYLGLLNNLCLVGTVPGQSIRTDCYTGMYNSSGSMIWSQRFAGNSFLSDDAGKNIAVDRDGNIYSVGYMDSNRIAYDFLSIKYDKNGNLIWYKRYSLSTFADDKAYFIGLDTLKNIYVTGISGGQIATIKYSQPPIGVVHIGSEIPLKYELLQNCPNPFNPSTEIEFDLPQNTLVDLRVYNAVGQVVAELVSKEYKTAGSYSVSFDGTNLASGIYFYSIEAGAYKDVKKMVLIK